MALINVSSSNDIPRIGDGRIITGISTVLGFSAALRVGAGDLLVLEAVEAMRRGDFVSLSADFECFDGAQFTAV